LKENLSINLPATDKVSLGENSPVIKAGSVSPSKKVEHKVAPKETIYSIAHRYNVKINDIVSWNNLQGYDLKTGQQLLIYKL
jgi:LysM repeat protein